MSETPVPGLTGQADEAAKAQLQAKMQSGGDWFFWIAGLSVVNTLMATFQSNTRFILGLAYTEIVDAIAQRSGGGAGIGMAVSILIAGIFVVFGLQARKRQTWAFIVGMGLYLLDGAIYAFFGDWLPVAIHAFALYSLWGGYQALRAMQKIDQPFLA